MVEEEKRQKKEAKEQQKQEYSKLPPLNINKPVAFGSSLLDEKPLGISLIYADELVKNRDNIIQETKKIEKIEVPVEDVEQRKKRFNEQRELIKAKNQEKRKEELM